MVLLRGIITVVAVAALGAMISKFELARGERSQPAPTPTRWVRTVDGWEPAEALRLAPNQSPTPALHPALVASLQAGISLFALMAFSDRAKDIRKKAA